jgi:pimeloyl-ACP methyl ester carboxylesterase
MPTTAVQDGTQINWNASGEGPTVVLTAHWYAHPDVLKGLAEELAVDHQMVTYDPRGTGASSRHGPYDLDTDADDLAAVVEAAGSPAAVLGWGDGAMRGARAARRHPDLIAAMVAVGGNPYGSSMLGTDTPMGSQAVLELFEQGLHTDYRSTVRGLLRASSLQMSEEEMRERVDEQIAYCPQEAAVGRLEAWTQTDGTADTMEIGDQIPIAVLLFETEFGPPHEIAARTRELLPRAEVKVLDDGPVSRPDLTAEAVRQVTAPLRIGDAASRE